MGAGIGDAGANLLAFVATGTWVWGDTMTTLAVLASIIITLSAVGLVIAIVFAPFVIVKEAKQDSDNKFMRGIANIKTLYKGHKEKFCPLVRKV